MIDPLVPELLWLGSYTPRFGGSGDGITALSVGPDGTLRPVGTMLEESPSFLAAHPTLPVVYAALEGDGQVQAYRQSGPARLARLGGPVAAGADVCHLTVSRDGRFLYAACYGDGALLRYRLGDEGQITAAGILAPAATDPYRSPFAGGIVPASPGEMGEAAFIDLSLAGLVAEATPERPSHAHATVQLPDGRIAQTDLGFDLVRIFRVTDTALVPDHDVMLPLGTGPRHLVVHPSGLIHVVTEYSGEVFTLRRGDDGRYLLHSGVRATADSLEDGDAPSEISQSASGDRLYVSVRGSNRVSTLAVTGDGSTLRPLADSDTGGDHPRHHLLVGGVLHVANQLSNAVTSLRLDARGVPGRVFSSLDAGSPTVLLAAHPERVASRA